jgi:hypothetical protein
MQFPITRERLQNLSKEFEEDQTQKFITILVENIKHSILMKAYHDSPNKTPTEYGIGARTPSKDKPKMLTLTLPLQLSVGGYQNPNQEKLIYIPPYNQLNSYLPIILKRLEESFPDVSFQVDPLKTYLLVDWS